MAKMLLAIVGKSTAGKSSCLRHLENQDRWLYLNCESGKPLPFKSKFKKEITITDPMAVYTVFEQATGHADIDGIIIDTGTYLMDMYESMYVLPAADTQKGWQNYQQFFKNLMQDKIANCDKDVIMLFHTADQINGESIRETVIPVKGALAKNGIESYFSFVIAAKRVNTRMLEGVSNPLLNIDEEEAALKTKYVLQTRVTADTINERLRAPIDLFSKNETFIDANIQHVITRFKEYFA